MTVLKHESYINLSEYRDSLLLFIDPNADTDSDTDTDTDTDIDFDSDGLTLPGEMFNQSTSSTLPGPDHMGPPVMQSSNEILHYTTYMSTMFRTSAQFGPELIPEERTLRLTDMLNRTSDMILSLVEQYF